MGRNAKDPELTKLARRLAAMTFDDEGYLLEAEAVQRFRESSSRYPFRYALQMPNMRTWAIRLYIGGANRIVGFTDHMSTALRYADMAAMTFWPYRIRGACEPVDADLNFSVEQAKKDLANETDATRLLEDIVIYLKNSGVLPDAKKLEEQRKADRKEREKRKTVRYEFMQLHDQVMLALKAIHEDIIILKRRTPFASFKRPVDLVGREPNKEWRTPEAGEVTGVGFSTYEADRKIVPFKVHITEHHYVEINVPVRIENGQEILLPEAHDMIEKTRREGKAAHEEAMREITAPQPAPEPVEVNALAAEDLFSTPTTPTQTK